MKYFNKIDAKDIYLSPISIDDAHVCEMVIRYKNK